MQPEVVEVGGLVLGMGPALGAIVGQDVALEVRCDDAEPALALVDPGQLRRAVTNLVRNARHATAGGGSIVVESSVRAGDGERGADPGSRWVVVRVTDTGSGIAPEVLPRIFDPFFTTDEFGQGSGLGLPVVDGFARQSLGHVRVASRVGEGSTFELWLPEHVAASEVLASEVPEPDALPEAEDGARGLTVLVAEDEAVVRAVARRVLMAAGHRVLLASSGREALDVAARFEGEIDVLLSDVVMPGIRGPELAEELRKDAARGPGRPGVRATPRTTSRAWGSLARRRRSWRSRTRWTCCWRRSRGASRPRRRFPSPRGVCATGRVYGRTAGRSSRPAARAVRGRPRGVTSAPLNG